jgi:DNA-binding response OmpR family regulator
LKKILLVDDDDDLREALSEQLGHDRGFRCVRGRQRHAEAMEQAKEALYDLVILDVGLPDTDGRELCRLMRKQGSNAHHDADRA